MDLVQTINEAVNMLLRRISVWGPITILGIVASVFYAFSLPRLYETTAVIQIGNSKLSDQVSSRNAGASLAQYLRKIEQRIMARDNLLEVIAKHGLFQEGPPLSPSEQVLALRQATRIEQITDPGQAWRPDAAPSALTVTVRMGDPETAAVIANDFVDRVLVQNRSERQKSANRALKFFDTEERRIGAEIANLDAVIAAFKRQNAASLPSALPTQQEKLVALETALLEVEQQIVELNNSKDKIRKADLKKQLRLAEDQHQLIESRRAEIQMALDTVPQVEKEFNILQRKLNQLEDQYSVIGKNRAEAEISQILEADQQSELLSVLETALVPEYPVSPNRKKIVAMGGIVSLILAGGLVVLLELLNPVIRTSAQLERQLNITPVVAIPILKKPQDKMFKRVWAVIWVLLGVLGIWQFVQFVNNRIGS